MLIWPEHPGLKRGLRTIKGVGPQIEERLKRRGYRTLGDLLFLMPNRYQDRREPVPIAGLAEGEEALIAGVITASKEGRFHKSYQKFFELTVEDDSGHIYAVWFRFPAHLRATVKTGRKVLLFGKMTKYRKRLQIVHPEVVAWDDEGAPEAEVRPVYPDLDDVRPGTIRRIMAEATRELAAMPTFFPKKWLDDRGLSDPTDALRTLHAPPADRPGSLPLPKESKAWRALAFFEMFLIQLVLARTRARLAETSGMAFPATSRLVDDYLGLLPFDLTPGQERAWDDISKNMSEPRPMNRLLQGDVGCGKTVVAMAACLKAIDGGTQAAIMAPTEVLARQHYRSFKPFAEKLGVRVSLIVGSLTEKEKRERREAASEGDLDLVFGTQALIAEGLAFKRLGLAVIDEQHRFGVAQRLALRAKADQPDLLVMTATPIPRSLAMTLYGDLDLSIIQGLPPGRTPIETLVFSGRNREEAYRILANEIESGGQAYIVAPRIEAGEEDEENGNGLESAEAVFEYVNGEVLPDACVGLVHGRMKAEEQQKVLGEFRSGEVRCLTATTVIEVGLDVPTASIILIEGAHRFGLAQLHQLRGRVGRGDRPSKCLLVANGDTETATARLQAMVRTTDGFELAEEDLSLRGPGDPIGLRQSGLPALTWASLPKDLPLLIRARDLAEEIIQNDPEIESPEFKLIREVADRMEEIVRTELADTG